MEKNILVINPGSTSVKIKIFNFNKNLLVEKNFQGEKRHSLFQSFLSSLEIPIHLALIRVVHAGEVKDEIQKVDSLLLEKIEKYKLLAPIHNRETLRFIFLLKEKNLKDIFAVFDSTFHSNIPEKHKRYLIKENLNLSFPIRKYGFHGIALRFILRKLKGIFKKEKKELPKKIVIAHLGGGSSITAVYNGNSYITSMEMSPNSGLPMISRSGTIDPALFSVLESQGYSLGEINYLLNFQSGFLGFLGTGDTKKIFEKAQEKENKKERLAFEIFRSEVLKKIFAYSGLMGGLDLLVFSGGIGFGNDFFRRSIINSVRNIFPSFLVEKIKVDEEEEMLHTFLISSWYTEKDEVI